MKRLLNQKTLLFVTGVKANTRLRLLNSWPFSTTLRDDVRIGCITGLPATPAL